MTFLTNALCISMVCMIGPALALATSQPASSGVALVIAPPWVQVEQMIENSGGTIVGPLTASFGVFATFDEVSFGTSLEGRGVWFVVDGGRIAAICGVMI